MSSPRPDASPFLLAPSVALTLYVVAVAALLFTVFAAVETIRDRRAAVTAAADLLAQIEGRRPGVAPGGVADAAGAVPAGSPFLEGETVTVAGAALLQRVAGAVTRVGGNVLSSQVDLQGPQSQAGYISVIASLEVEHAALQQLLYDIEVGMPFLFIDQVVAQAPVASTESDGGRMRVLLAVSGQWQGAR